MEGKDTWAAIEINSGGSNIMQMLPSQASILTSEKTLGQIQFKVLTEMHSKTHKLLSRRQNTWPSQTFSMYSYYSECTYTAKATQTCISKQAPRKSVTASKRASLPIPHPPSQVHPQLSRGIFSYYKDSFHSGCKQVGHLQGEAPQQEQLVLWVLPFAGLRGPELRNTDHRSRFPTVVALDTTDILNDTNPVFE